MYLSKLSMHGFKSFAQQTELKFDPGVTAVVGPNGCGKSNIVGCSAMGDRRAKSTCFAIGQDEQRHL